MKAHSGDSKAQERLQLEDLRNHSSEQLTELRRLLNSGASLRLDPKRPGFFELDGQAHVFYIFRYPSRNKVLLIAVWERNQVSAMRQ